MTGSTLYGEFANVVCNTGYVGGGNAYCETNGDWRMPLPSCAPIGKSSLILSDRCTITCGCKTVVKGVTFIMEQIFNQTFQCIYMYMMNWP